MQQVTDDDHGPALAVSQSILIPALKPVSTKRKVTKSCAGTVAGANALQKSSIEPVQIIDVLEPSSETGDESVLQVACAGCGQLVAHCYIDVDHQQARFMGGPDISDNLQPLCLRCHRSKSLFEQQVVAPTRRVVLAKIRHLRSFGVVDDDTDITELVNKIMLLMVPHINIQKARAFACGTKPSKNRKRQFEAAVDSRSLGLHQRRKRQHRLRQQQQHDER